MPYCNQCGSFVLDEDRFCPKCGREQASGAAAAIPVPPSLGGASGEAVSSPAPGPEAPPARETIAASPIPPSSPPSSGGESTPPPAAPPLRPAGAPLDSNVAAMLCYVPGLGWVAALIFLTLEAYRRDRYVRFHAFQALFLAMAFLVVQHLFFPFHFNFFPFVSRKLFMALVVVAQVFGIVKTLNRQEFRLPVFSELADRSMA